MNIEKSSRSDGKSTTKLIFCLLFTFICFSTLLSEGGKNYSRKKVTGQSSSKHTHYKPAIGFYPSFSIYNLENSVGTENLISSLDKSSNYLDSSFGHIDGITQKKWNFTLDQDKLSMNPRYLPSPTLSLVSFNMLLTKSDSLTVATKASFDTSSGIKQRNVLDLDNKGGGYLLIKGLPNPESIRRALNKTGIKNPKFELVSFGGDYRKSQSEKNLVTLLKIEKKDSNKPSIEVLYVGPVNGEKSQKRYYAFAWDGRKPEFFDFSGVSVKEKNVFSSPLNVSYRISSKFGPRYHPISNFVKMHTGVDYATGYGSAVKASADGVIEYLGYKGGYGRYVMIAHGNGLKTGYAHLAAYAPHISRGSKVKCGELIGKVGSSGFSTGPHLHFEVMKNNRFVNPLTNNTKTSVKLPPTALKKFRQNSSEIDGIVKKLLENDSVAEA